MLSLYCFDYYDILFKLIKLKPIELSKLVNTIFLFTIFELLYLF